jgi:hypothetical protein
MLAAGTLIGGFKVDRQTKVSPQPERHRGKNKPELKLTSTKPK